MACGALMAGCAGTSVGASSGATASSSAPSTEDLAIAHRPEDLSQCTPPAGAALSDIASVVDWINAMPKPLTLACFVASLPRPITYNATQSNFSAQPSIGRHNPRIFVKVDKLWLSFVPQEGASRLEDPTTGEEILTWDPDNIQLLELSYEVDTNRQFQQTLKAELGFPVLAALPYSAPYSKVAMNTNRTGSLCGDCHGSETIVDFVDEYPVFRSTMLRNAASQEISHGYLVNQYLTCDPAINTGYTDENYEWYRCQMLEAFFGQGQMIWESFKEDIAVFR